MRSSRQGIILAKSSRLKLLSKSVTEVENNTFTELFLLRKTTKLHYMYTNVAFAQWKLLSCSVRKMLDVKQV